MSDILESSFRDPAGFLFKSDGNLYRQINSRYKETFESLVKSRFFQKLFERQLLVPHKKTDIPCLTNDGYQVIAPLELPFISYPYEWPFSQLKEAALLTLEIQELAIDNGFSLKDASAYNIQFYEGRPIFIDTLSFETLAEGKPWVAYKQFCQHFLAPLALMARKNIALQQLLKNYIDGIPLELTSELLPWTTKFNFSLLVHIHLHAKSQARHADKSIATQKSFSKHAFRALLDNLRTTIEKLEWKADGTEWNDYYQANNNYASDSLSLKERIVGSFIKETSPDSVWDLGANTGRFSVIAAEHSRYVCAWDIDPACVENNYLSLKEQKLRNIYPLLLDLSNPSPATGWANRERFSFRERGRVDLVLALGLIHHLAISNGLPLAKVASFFADMGSSLIIEFVPKSDSQVARLLRSREDIFCDYEKEGFEREFSRYFDILKSEKISGSQRTLYLMSTK